MSLFGLSEQVSWSTLLVVAAVVLVSLVPKRKEGP